MGTYGTKTNAGSKASQSGQPSAVSEKQGFDYQATLQQIQKFSDVSLKLYKSLPAPSSVSKWRVTIKEPLFGAVGHPGFTELCNLYADVQKTFGAYGRECSDAMTSAQGKDLLTMTGHLYAAGKLYENYISAVAAYKAKFDDYNSTSFSDVFGRVLDGASLVLLPTLVANISRAAATYGGRELAKQIGRNMSSKAVLERATASSTVFSALFTGAMVYDTNMLNKKVEEFKKEPLKSVAELKKGLAKIQKSLESYEGGDKEYLLIGLEGASKNLLQCEQSLNAFNVKPNLEKAAEFFGQSFFTFMLFEVGFRSLFPPKIKFTPKNKPVESTTHQKNPITFKIRSPVPNEGGAGTGSKTEPEIKFKIITQAESTNQGSKPANQGPPFKFTLRSKPEPTGEAGTRANAGAKKKFEFKPTEILDAKKIKRMPEENSASTGFIFRPLEPSDAEFQGILARLCSNQDFKAAYLKAQTAISRLNSNTSAHRIAATDGRTSEPGQMTKEFKILLKSLQSVDIGFATRLVKMLCEHPGLVDCMRQKYCRLIDGNPEGLGAILEKNLAEDAGIAKSISHYAQKFPSPHQSNIETAVGDIKQSLDAGGIHMGIDKITSYVDAYFSKISGKLSMPDVLSRDYVARGSSGEYIAVNDIVKMAELDSKCPGASRLLSDKCDIIRFGRYPLDLLENQYLLLTGRRTLNANNRTAIVVFAYEDLEGALHGGVADLHALSKDYNFIWTEASSKMDVGRKIVEYSKLTFDQTKNLPKGIVVAGHGYGPGVLMLSKSKSGVLLASELFGSNQGRGVNYSRYFDEDPFALFYSCSQGAKDGLADLGNRANNSFTTSGPEIPASADKFVITPSGHIEGEYRVSGEKVRSVVYPAKKK